jgi:hypothetical protein
MKNEDNEEQRSELATGKRLRSSLARKGTSIDVTVDLLLQMIDPKEDGDDASGATVRVCKYLVLRR